MPGITSRFADCHVFRILPDGTDEWLIMKRAPGILLGGTWQMVQGHIEDGETAYQTAYRELGEETGLRPEAFYQVSYVNRFYLAVSDQVILSPVFAARVAADARVVLSEEHTDHRWVTSADAMAAYPWPGQRKSLKIAREQFVLQEPRAESLLDDLVRSPRVDSDAAKSL